MDDSEIEVIKKLALPRVSKYELYKYKIINISYYLSNIYSEYLIGEFEA